MIQFTPMVKLYNSVFLINKNLYSWTFQVSFMAKNAHCLLFYNYVRIRNKLWYYDIS